MKMYREGGVTGDFKTEQQGRDSGFFPTFNEMASDCRRRLNESKAPKPIEAATQAPPAPPADDDDTGAPTPPIDEDEPLTRAEILDYAESHGLDTTIHHLHLRKQVEEMINAEGGSDQPGVCGDTD